MIYFFGEGKADGNESLKKNLLGGKGANLAEMAGHQNLKLPVRFHYYHRGLRLLPNKKKPTRTD